MEITRETCDMMIQFPYIDEKINAEQLVMYTFIMTNLENLGNKTFNLKSRLNELGYSKFDYHEGYILCDDGSIDIIALIVGIFGDLESIPFHIIPEIVEVDGGSIDRRYELEELNYFISCAIDMFKKGISSPSRYLTKDVRNGSFIILTKDINAYEQRLQNLQSCLDKMDLHTPEVLIEDTENKINKIKSKLEQTKKNIKIIDYVDNEALKFTS